MPVCAGSETSSRRPPAPDRADGTTWAGQRRRASRRSAAPGDEASPRCSETTIRARRRRDLHRSIELRARERSPSRRALAIEPPVALITGRGRNQKLDGIPALFAPQAAAASRCDKRQAFATLARGPKDMVPAHPALRARSWRRVATETRSAPQNGPVDAAARRVSGRGSAVPAGPPRVGRGEQVTAVPPGWRRGSRSRAHVYSSRLS